MNELLTDYLDYLKSLNYSNRTIQASTYINLNFILYLKNRGVDKAVNTLISLTKGEFTADKYNSKSKKKSNSRNTILIVILVIIVLARMIFKNRGGGRSGSIGTGGASGGASFSVPLIAGDFTAGLIIRLGD